jgi:hypothetical protein
MRLFLVMLLCALLAGCGTSRQADQQDAAEPAPFDLNDALAECRHAYPDQMTQAVARAGCVIKATEQLRSVLPFPDLLDQENALRKSLAGQVEGRKLSLIERNRQITKLHSKILAEEQSRLLANPSAAEAKGSVGATQWRLSNSDGCVSLAGNTANCY